MTYDALALSCRMMTCLWCHRHVMEDLFRPMQYPFPQLPSCLWTAAHLLVCERKNGNPKNVTFIPYWFCNTSVGWAVDETPLWRHREHVAVRPVADHGWWVAGAEAVLTSACATLSRDAASGGITDMFFFPFYKIYHHLAYGRIGLLLFYMSICLLLLVKGQVICFTLGHLVSSPWCD